MIYISSVFLIIFCFLLFAVFFKFLVTLTFKSCRKKKENLGYCNRSIIISWLVTAYKCLEPGDVLVCMNGEVSYAFRLTINLCSRLSLATWEERRSLLSREVVVSFGYANPVHVAISIAIEVMRCFCFLGSELGPSILHFTIWWFALGDNVGFGLN